MSGLELTTLQVAMALGLFSGSQAAKPPSGGDDLVRATTTRDFVRDVIQASAGAIVLVDFWAPWCGPCKQLTPVLEKLVRQKKGAVKLVTLNIDEHPAIAQQMGVQSIPAVFAFSGGRPVDGFVGQLPESQVKRFIETLVGPVAEPVSIVDAQALAAAGDAAGAAAIFAQLAAADPGNAEAFAGLARCQIDAGDMDAATRTLAAASPETRKHAAFIAAQAAIDFARKNGEFRRMDSAALERRIAADPTDHAARIDLALALNARGDRAEALTALLAAIRADRDWNEGAARKQLLELFGVWGPSDKLTQQGRQKLSTLLFA